MSGKRNVSVCRGHELANALYRSENIRDTCEKAGRHTVMGNAKKERLRTASVGRRYYCVLTTKIDNRGKLKGRRARAAMSILVRSSNSQITSMHIHANSVD